MAAAPVPPFLQHYKQAVLDEKLSANMPCPQCSSARILLICSLKTPHQATELFKFSELMLIRGH